LSPAKKKKRRSRRSSRKRGFFARWRRRVTFLLLALALICFALAYAYHVHVVAHPGPHLDRQWILSAVSQESPVYYRDGSSKIGVFFDEHHRQYVPYDEIPTTFVHALVAAEDSRFFDHHGFDGRGIARAMWHNIQAGRVVEGGSTLTQQTAENLFYATRAFTWKDKAYEAVDALRLEYHYEKQDILEFYANQFYVNGNGRGLGIAARYFFDKDVSELDDLECAFLAGVVQSPSRFDPFIGENEESRQRSITRAHERTAYVLDRMVLEGYIDAAAREELGSRQIPFERGRFRYPYDVVLESVARELSSEQFLDVLELHGIDNPSTAGVEVVTTLDRRIQTEALYGLRHHLTEVGIPLEGVTLGEVVQPAEEVRPVARADVRPHTFHWGRIVSVDPGARAMEIDLGGTRGVVDADGCVRLATLLKQSEQRNKWAEASRGETRDLLERVPVGGRVWTSVREVDGETLRLDVEHMTELQGAIVVLDAGEIRAMVGGNRNRDYNRAQQARRQFGSTFKPLVYTAALQLGWTLTDELDNRRDVFPFEGSFYYPRPDHSGAPEKVGLAWAGVHSENLASVWLLYHLLDHLNEAQFREVAQIAGLTRSKDETREEYIERIRDTEGVVPTEDRMREGLFERVREDVQVDLQFDGLQTEAEALARLHYGLLFDTERQRQSDAERLEILRRSFLSVEGRSRECLEDVASMRALAEEGSAVRPADGLMLGVLDGRRVISCGEGEGAWVPLDSAAMQRLDDTGSLPEMLADDAVLVEGQLSLATIAAVRQEIEGRLETLSGGDPYRLSTLSLLRDFRTLVAVRYVIALAAEMGVESSLATGLSLPLGSSDISLQELALLYQCMVRGDTIRFDPTVSARRTAVISEIRLRDGTVIYRAEGTTRPLLDDPIPDELAQVLLNVVDHGTGQRAAADLPGVPLAGKTGTTNSYRNAAFVGVVPYPGEAAWSVRQGMVVASYVGYDDNRQMSRGSIRLAGATGSLPAWLGAAHGVLDSYPGRRPPVDSLVRSAGLERIVVDPASGLPMGASADGVGLYRASGGKGRYAPFEPGRRR